jgi:uncharacterized iron-regulated protein
MLKKSTLFLLSAILLMSMSADKRAYQYFNSKGKAVNFSQVINEIKDADIVMFGELHNNAISHWMEYEIVKALYAEKGDKLVLGAEMYESDQQLLVDEYLSGKVEYKYFKQQARLWPNDETDYHPILAFAQENKIPFIATNIPRRYAAMVNNGDFAALDSISDAAKALIAPMPIKYDAELGCYKDMLSMMGGHVPASMKNIAKAQAMKDATMAHFILKNWKQGDCFFHFNGGYHSANHESIVWYLKQANPDLKIVTIATTEQENVEEIDKESLKEADFILVANENITKTY